MKMVMLSSCLAAVLMAGLVPGVRAADTDAAREAKDRTEIEQLMWKYVRALDTLNEDAYAAVYTPDGSFGTGPKMSKGKDALKKIIADVKKSQSERAAKGEEVPKMHHIITNTYLEFLDKDHARLNSYWMTVFEGSGQDKPPRVAAAGRGVDELVRLNGKWLISARDVAPKD
jgi:hypothetical protein